MSHELRTPLNVIIGYTDLLREGAFGDVSSEQSHTLGRVETSARELLSLINATLDVSRLEGGHVALDLTDVLIEPLIDELDSETRELRAAAGLAWERDLAPDLPPLRTDAMKLKVVLKNLVANAVKFTKQGHVAIRVVRRDRGVEFAVTDTGIGIEPDALPIIFEPFRQAGSWVIREYGGVGLGLYIVRRLVDMLGGTVAVDSQPGHGSTFRVWLPRTTGAEARRDASDNGHPL